MPLILREDFNDAVDRVLNDFAGVTKLNEHQSDALFHLIQRQDVFAILPTGFGKSLIFQLLPALCRELHTMGYKIFSTNAIVLVICPLVALIDSHMKELTKRGISCACLSGTEAVQDTKGVLTGKFSFVFANPEAIILNEKWREMLQSPIYQRNLFGIVADEAHVIPKWGFGNSKQKIIAFRECFGRLGELRSLIPDGTPILALTATAAKKTREEITKALNLRTDHHKIIVSPDRHNIYLYKVKVNDNLAISFDWLLSKLKLEHVSCPQTLVYCKTTKECSHLFTFFKDNLGNFAYASNTKHVAENMLIGMYHHNTLEKYKKRVIDALYDPAGTCRVVFCTNALGMGINFAEIRYVVHYGPPCNVEEFVQEIGRGGRDGKPTVAILLFQGKHLRKCDRQIKHYAKCEESECMRALLLAEFGEAKDVNVMGHDCCLLCHERCCCSGVDTCSKQIPFVLHKRQSGSKPKALLKKRKTMPEELKLLKELLNDYQQKLVNVCPSYFLSPECSTGFSNNLIKSVLSKAKYIFDLEYVLDNLPIFKVQHGIDIVYMCADVFDDFTVHIDPKYQETKLADQFFVDQYDLEYGGNYCEGEHYEDSGSDESEHEP